MNRPMLLVAVLLTVSGRAGGTTRGTNLDANCWDVGRSFDNRDDISGDHNFCATCGCPTGTHCTGQPNRIPSRNQLEGGHMKPVIQTATESKGLAAGAPPRIKAAATDLSIIVGWLAFAGLVGWVLRLLKVLDLGIESAGTRDLFAFVTVVLPVMVTFALLEASPRRATPGKRRVGLVVIDGEGQRLSFGRSLVRSVVKFTPWQMAHTAVFYLLAGSTAVEYFALSITAQVLVLASVAMMTIDPEHRALHDLIARTRVRTRPR